MAPPTKKNPQKYPYQVGMMTSIRISKRSVVLDKWAKLALPRHAPVPASSFYDFSYYTQSKAKILNYLDRDEIDEDSSFERLS